MDAAELARRLRVLPAVDRLLGHPTLRALGELYGHERAREFAQQALAERREAVRAARAPEVAGDELLVELARAARALAERDAQRALTRAVNATGVVLHTGLGRAVIHEEAAAAMAAAAASYVTLEIDRESGGRGRRDARAGALAARLFGAEAALCVNNCAAAVLLTLAALAKDKEVIVARGELVEIGGSFRMPDVMRAAGATLREIGTTNRTRAADVRAALDPGRTGLLLKVHTSNFRVVGFTAEITVEEFAALGREAGMPTAFDAGSGLFVAPGRQAPPGTAGEPDVRAAVAAGIDLVMISGDKLLGGPQAGIVLGAERVLARLRAHPIYRAVRLDKVTLAGLERTLELLLAGREDELPARRMLALPLEEIDARARALATALARLPGVRASVRDGGSRPGSGSAPDVELPTRLVAVSVGALSATELAARLRRSDPPVFTRIHEDVVLLDPRTLLAGDDERLLAAFAAGIAS